MKYSKIAVSFALLLIIGSESNADVAIKHWPNGKIRTATETNDAGNVVRTNYYRENGSLEQDTIYDIYGNKIEEAYFNSDGSLKVNADGWSAITWKFVGGKMSVENYFGANGVLKERKSYSPSGALIKKQYVGDPDMPEEEYNPAPSMQGMTIEYYNK